MSTKPRERILLLAIVLGVVAAVMIYSYLAGQTNARVTKVPVVVAASAIPKDAKLTADMLKISQFPSNLVPPGAATSQEMVVGRVALADLKAGEPIPTASIEDPSEITYLVPPGMRAVTIGVDQVIGVAGFLKPKNHVDVIATFEVESSTYTRTVLQNVMLIAIDSDVAEPGETTQTGKVEAKPATTATLAVMPQDAEKLILADLKGKIRLALRSRQDNSVVTSKPLSASKVIGVAPSKPSSSVSRPAGPTGQPPIFQTTVPPASVQTTVTGPLPGTPPEQNGKAIEIYRGTELSIEVVKKQGS